MDYGYLVFEKLLDRNYPTHTEALVLLISYCYSINSIRYISYQPLYLYACCYTPHHTTHVAISFPPILYTFSLIHLY